MKIHILGSSGSKTKDSGFVSILIDDILLIDAGNILGALDFKRQEKIKYILISHSHLDHIKDICFLADNRILLSSSQFRIFSSKDTLRNLKVHIFNNEVWPDFTKLPSEEEPVLVLNSVDFDKSFKLDGYRIKFLKTKHIKGSAAFLISKDGKTILYTGDIGFDKQFWKKLSYERIDILFVDISFPNRLRQLAMQTDHLTPELFFECVKELDDIPKRIYAFHNKLNFSEEINKELSVNPFSGTEISSLKDGTLFKI